MGFLGMGWLELTVIVIAAILVFGPDRLPEVASQAGKLLRDLRNMTADMTGEFERQTGVNPMDLRQQVEKEMAGVKSSFDQAAGGVTKELTATAGTLKSSTSKSSAAAKKTGAATSAAAITAKSKTTSTTSKSATAKDAAPEPPKASKRDPFADVSFLDNPGETPTAKPVKVEPIVTMSNGSSSASADGDSPSGEIADAIARARQRKAELAGQTATVAGP